MAIEFVCPACGGTLQVGDDTAGRVIRCGGCMTALTVPDPDRRAAAPDPYAVDRPAPAPPRPRSAPSSPPDEPRRRDDRPDRDDRSDERTRRRRPPPPAPGRGVFFWLVIIGAVMLIGTVACCGGVFLLLPGAKWQKHESKPGEFRVDLPNKVQPDVAKAAKISLKDVKSEGTVLLKRGAVQFVVFYRIPDAKKPPAKNPIETDEQVIEKVTQELLTAMQDDENRGQKAQTRAAPYLGFAGREVDFVGRSGFYTARVIVADKRVYVLLGGGGTAQWGDADVRRFLDSFEITNAELKGEGDRRAEQAQKKADEDKKAADASAEAAKSREERKARLRLQSDLNDAAELVGGAAVGAALSEARPVERLPVAPPPRPIDDD